MNKNIINLLTIPLLALGLSGCTKDNNPYFSRCKQKGDYIVTAYRDRTGNNFIMDYYTMPRNSRSYLHASDNTINSNLEDGRFDEITLWGVPKGDPIEKYVNLDSISKLFNEVKETGCNCDSLYKVFQGGKKWH